MPYVMQKYHVKVPRSSGFDKSHRYSGTGQCGTLIPVMCDEVIPGSKVRLRVPFAAQLPPLASETYMNCQVKYEAFFVPFRLLCSSFESFFNDFADRIQVNDQWINLKGLLPIVEISSAGDEPQVVARSTPGSLLDYLGFCSPLAHGDLNPVSINPAPLVAYHLIWQEWYRNPRVQNPAFSKPVSLYGALSHAQAASVIPFSFYHAGDSSLGLPSNYYWRAGDGVYDLADGKSLFDLRQRNFGLDYFTGARLSAQQGDPSGVTIDTSGSEGTMTIAALRAANSLQQFRERNNLASPRFIDQIFSRYGVRPSDGVAQRPICIGSASYDISTRGVDQTAATGSGSSANPFDSVAAQFGRGAVMGQDFLIDNFEALEPGYIMVLQSLVPEATYTIGVDPMFDRYKGSGSVVQMANPLLQNVGDQPIFGSELLPVGYLESGGIFGYTDRFADFFFKKNTVHGLMRSGQSLGAFVLQRDFSNVESISLSSKFLEIPTDYLDQVLAVSSQASGVGYWFDIYFDYKVTMPLAEYSIPSLEDPAYEHGKSISLRRNGQIF